MLSCRGAAGICCAVNSFFHMYYYLVSFRMTIKKVLALLIYFVAIQAYTQKPLLDSVALFTWPKVSSQNAALSTSGDYCAFTIENQPRNAETLVIQNTSSGAKREFIDATFCFFSSDNKQAVFKKGDTLFFYSLKTNEVTWIPNVLSYRYPESGG